MTLLKILLKSCLIIRALETNIKTILIIDTILKKGDNVNLNPQKLLPKIIR